jgi:hypothetical protein
MPFFLGLLILSAGLGLTVKTEWFINNFGRIAWFEQKLGSEGGSRLGYKLVGLAAITIGIIVMTGGGQDLLGWITSPFVKYNQ